MTTQIKITQLTDIGSANLAVTTLLPVVNMAGLPTTQKTTLGNLANVILSQAGGNYAPVGTANIAYSVSNAAQPNITSVGTLTNVAVSGNATVNGNITSNGTAYVGNLSTTGLASITTLNVGTTANLGAIGNVTITGGSAGQKLTTNGNGGLSWTDDAVSSYGNSNVANYLPIFTSANIGNSTAGLGVTNLNMAGNIVATTQSMNVNWGSYTMYFNQLGNLSLNANLQVNANISNANVITANYFSGDGSNLTNITGDTGDINFNGANISTNTQNANISINGYGSDAHVTITSNSQAWTFEPYGTLDFPDGSRIGRTDGNNAIGIDVFTGDKFVIQTEDSSNNIYSWQFTPLGALVVPDQNPGQASIISYSGGNTNVASFISFVTPDSANLVLGTTSNNHVVINTDKANANVRWSFDDLGVTHFPDGTDFIPNIEGANTIGFATVANSEFLIETSNGSNGYVWAFEPNGTTLFPTLTVDIHNGGNQQAQTLQFSDPTLQAIITGPTPSANINAQRLIIQGQRGNGTYSEGGDVYVWAGDADTNGGDIKIYAGDADVSGYGGYINLDAGSGVDGGGQLTLTGGGSTNGAGGQISITPGYSGNANGALLSLNGGQGSGDGGNVNITAGYGGANGGQVTITGGQSALGLSGYGNVVINAGASGWTFDNGGNLTVPGEGIIQSINDTVILRSVDANSNIYSARLGTNGGLYFETTAYPTGWLSLTNNSGNANITAATGTAGGAGKNIIINAGDADQSDFYTSAGGNINITGGLGAFNDGGGGGPGGSINLTAGNSSDPAGHAGNVKITAGSNDWVFDYNGNLTIPGNLIAATASPAPILSGFGIVSAESFTSSVVAYASLPAPTTAGRRAFINDANLVAVGNFGNVVGNGGSNTVCVWSDGTDWRIG